MANEGVLVLFDTLPLEVLDRGLEDFVDEGLVLSDDSDFAFEDLFRPCTLVVLMKADSHLTKVEFASSQDRSQDLVVLLFYYVVDEVTELKGVPAQLNEVNLRLHHVLAVLVQEGNH